MGAEPLDREMCFAGIGRAEHGLDAAVGGAAVHSGNVAAPPRFRNRKGSCLNS
jgi:hypothetical protein